VEHGRNSRPILTVRNFFRCVQQWHGVERGNFNPVDALCVFGIPVTTPNDLFGDNFGGIQSKEIPVGELTKKHCYLLLALHMADK
jgi:hypothetical protein